MDKDLPMLTHYLCAYLFPYWQDDYSDEEEAFDDFLRGTPGAVVQFPAEVERILDTDPSEPALGQLFTNLGSTYDPIDYPGGRRAWLTMLRNRALRLHPE